MAFSGWGMCVTLAETDAAMLRALKTDPEVTAIFLAVAPRQRFRDAIREVEHSFPLASFSDLRTNSVTGATVMLYIASRPNGR